MSIKDTLPIWEQSIRALFPVNVPKRVVWTNIDDIIAVLNHIGGYPRNLNHTFLPEGGGLDLTGAQHSVEPDCIELKLDGGTEIVRPVSLSFISFEGQLEWAYFRLETAGLSPSGVYPQINGVYEELTELSPGRYVERSYWDAGEYNGAPLPRDARVISRVLSGAYVTFAKASDYNQETYRGFDAYNAPHNKMTADDFEQFVDRLRKL